jgi:hypothetical protein
MTSILRTLGQIPKFQLGVLFLLLLTTSVLTFLYWYIAKYPWDMRAKYDELMNENPVANINPYLLQDRSDSGLFYDIVQPSIFSTDFTFFPLEQPNKDLISSMLNQTSKINRGIYWPPQISPPQTDITKRVDYPFIFPSDAIYFEEQSFTFNVSTQPLPNNPSGYRYYSTRRIETYLPKWQSEDMPHSDWPHRTSQVLASCFSDWFPFELIRDQDTSHKAWESKQSQYYDPYHPVSDDITSQEEREKLKRYHIDMDKIDKDKLANYYGYKSYSDLPHHPRVPSSTTNSQIKWVHRCVTPWKFDNELTTIHDYSYFAKFPGDRAMVFLGTEDFRTWYDRCGRLKLVYSSFNTRFPVHPDLGLALVDGRRSDPRLQFSLIDVCPSGKFFYPEPTDGLDGARLGHMETWEKNHLELNYGFGESDLGEMTKWVSQVEKFGTKFDPRSNSILFTKNDYNQLLSYRRNLYLDGLSKKDWQDLMKPLTGSTLFRFKNPDSYDELLKLESIYLIKTPYPSLQQYHPKKDENKIKSIIKNWQNDENIRTQLLSNLQEIKSTIHKNSNHYFHQNDVLMTHSFPMTVQNSTMFYTESRDRSIRQCLLDFGKHNPPEAFNAHIFVDSFHSATQFYLIRLTDKDYEDQKVTVPKERRSEWVYWAIGHDRSQFNNKNKLSKEHRTHRAYRPVVIMMDAITLELIAVLPIQPTTPDMCRNQPKHCYTGGIGPKCERHCYFSYIHSIFPVHTPLSYTILEDNESNDGDNDIDIDTINTLKINKESLHDLFSDSHAPQMPPHPLKPTPTKPNSSNSTHTSSQSHSLHRILPTWHTLDTQWFLSVNFNDEISVFQEIDLRALWYHRHLCPNEQRDKNGYKNWDFHDWAKEDPVELKFVYQQRPDRLFPFIPTSLISADVRRFYSWETYWVTLAEWRKAVFASLALTVIWIAFMFWMFKRAR